jgi:heme exporter protein C
MLWPLLVMALGFMLFFAALLMIRMRTALIAAKIRALRLAEVERHQSRVLTQQTAIP